MKDLFNRQFDTLVRVSAFYRKHSHLFSPESLSAKMFEVIGEAIAELTRHIGSQAAGSALAREGSISRAEARQALRDCLEAITRTSRSIGRGHPETLSKFRMPREVGDRELLGAAIGFLARVGPMRDVFVAHEMEPDFVEQLEASIKHLEDAIQEYSEKKTIQTTATSSIEETMQKAMDAVYRLAGVVPNRLKRNSSVLREWDIARRVASARVVSKSPEPEPEPPPGAGATTTA
jgi:hypothetical protein